MDGGGAASSGTLAFGPLWVMTPDLDKDACGLTPSSLGRTTSRLRPPPCSSYWDRSEGHSCVVAVRRRVNPATLFPSNTHKGRAHTRRSIDIYPSPPHTGHLRCPAGRQPHNPDSSAPPPRAHSLTLGAPASSQTLNPQGSQGPAPRAGRGQPLSRGRSPLFQAGRYAQDRTRPAAQLSLASYQRGRHS